MRWASEPWEPFVPTPISRRACPGLWPTHIEGPLRARHVTHSTTVDIFLGMNWLDVFRNHDMITVSKSATQNRKARQRGAHQVSGSRSGETVHNRGTQRTARGSRGCLVGERGEASPQGRPARPGSGPSGVYRREAVGSGAVAQLAVAVATPALERAGVLLTTTLSEPALHQIAPATSLRLA